MNINTETTPSIHRDPPVARLVSLGVRHRFPALRRTINGERLVYLDCAATSLRPDEVIDAGCTFCRTQDGNPHRGMHVLSAEATETLEGARAKIVEWLGGTADANGIFTRNATGALNLAARGFEHEIQPGDEIVLSQMEHHANLVPWLMLAKRTRAVIRYIPLSTDSALDLGEANRIIGPRTRIVSVAHISNVLGTVNPIAQLSAMAHAHGAIMIVDAAQSVGHREMSFAELGVDLLVFSAHKCYGPSGLGVLLGTEEILARMEPSDFGGDMIESVSFQDATWAPVPHRFEAGTVNAQAAAGFSTTIDFVNELGLDRIQAHEATIASYAHERLLSLGGLRILGPTPREDRGSVISFVDTLVPAHDMATVLDQAAVAVRAGDHCAQPLHRLLQIPSTVRASFGVYSELQDIDALIDAMGTARRIFRR